MKGITVHSLYIGYNCLITDLRPSNLSFYVRCLTNNGGCWSTGEPLEHKRICNQ